MVVRSSQGGCKTETRVPEVLNLRVSVTDENMIAKI